MVETLISPTSTTTSTKAMELMTSIVSSATSEATSTMETTPTLAMTTLSVSASIVSTVATARMEEEGGKDKIKEFAFSKQVGIVLEKGKKFFLGRKEGNPKLLR